MARTSVENKIYLKSYTHSDSGKEDEVSIH